jgi:hypothetical protein
MAESGTKNNWKKWQKQEKNQGQGAFTLDRFARMSFPLQIGSVWDSLKTNPGFKLDLKFIVNTATKPFTSNYQIKATSCPGSFDRPSGDNLRRSVKTSDQER